MDMLCLCLGICFLGFVIVIDYGVCYDEKGSEKNIGYLRENLMINEDEYIHPQSTVIEDFIKELHFASVKHCLCNFFARTESFFTCFTAIHRRLNQIRNVPGFRIHLLLM